MLTAIVQRLYDINKEQSLERKRKLIEVCSSAYPDVRPWQVKKMCNLQSESVDATFMANLYYTYLSLLLHASEGHESARRDPKLVSVRFLGLFYFCFWLYRK